MASFLKFKKDKKETDEVQTLESTVSLDMNDVNADAIEEKYLGKSLAYLTEEKKRLEDTSVELSKKMETLQQEYSELLEKRKKISKEQQQALDDFNAASLDCLENELPSSIVALSQDDVSNDDGELQSFFEQKKILLQQMKSVEDEKDVLCSELDQALFDKAEEINRVREENDQIIQTHKYIDEAINDVGNDIEVSPEEIPFDKKKKKPKISTHRLVANKVKGISFLNLCSLLKKDCEVEYSMLKLIIHYAIAFVVIALIGMLYSLKLPYVLVLALVYFIFGPSLIYFKYRKKYEKKKFTTAVRYIEQMIFSFTRRSKLLNALEETRVLMSGKIGEAIDYAVDKIRHGKSEKNLNEEALEEIEKIFPCTRVKNLHEFIIDVENVGGKYSSALDIMLEDVREWDVRTNNFQQEQTVKGISMVISILMSLGVCFFMTNILPDDLGGNISGYGLYQVLTTISLVVMFLIYRLSAKKLTSSWVNDDLGEDEKRIKSDYETVRRYAENPSGKIKPVLAITRMQTAMEKAFPRWVMRFSLLASTKPIPVALTESVSKAPVVMHDELIKLNESLIEDPYSIRPYINFFKDFDIPQVRSMMMMVYSLGSSDSKDIEKHILSIVKRNHLLQAAAEKIEYDEKMAMFTLFSTVPMLLACVIMMIDVAMIIMNMLNTVL